ncbi:hypothetical protein B7R21_05040 [Subtercola boreus]|uniref:DUF916 domain-containing protein n=1 Tax=Subtercola boreus TaxID=120213 RepID=A0A3E0W1J9_9MICO|nr:hypothetical protein [Subtercola boreus]RFA15383.1 hypothetical protein B7R21_05040 [Subtercola boreus]
MTRTLAAAAAAAPSATARPPRAVLRAGATSTAFAALLLLGMLVPATAAEAVEGPSWGVAPADTALGANRANFEYALAPGAVVDDAFEVTNNGITPLLLKVYAADAFTTREGTIDLLAGGEPSVDSGTWVTLGASDITLTPGQVMVIPFTITVPQDARPGDHPTGIVSSILSTDAGAEVQVDRRLGSRMYIRVDGDLAPAATVSGLTVDYSGSWNPLAVGALDVSYTLSNTGNTRVTALTNLTVEGPFGIAPARTGDEQLPEVLPGSTIDVHQRISGVAALLWLSGAVTVLPTAVGLGAVPLDSVSTPYGMLALPFWLLILVLVLALVVVGVLLALRRRRRARAARPARAVAFASASASDPDPATAPTSDPDPAPAP